MVPVHLGCEQGGSFPPLSPSAPETPGMMRCPQRSGRRSGCIFFHCREHSGCYLAQNLERRFCLLRRSVAVIASDRISHQTLSLGGGSAIRALWWPPGWRCFAQSLLSMPSAHKDHSFETPQPVYFSAGRDTEIRFLPRPSFPSTKMDHISSSEMLTPFLSLQWEFYLKRNQTF